MGHHCQLRADGVSGPAEAKLYSLASAGPHTPYMGKGNKGGERKVPGALLRTKRYNSMGTPLYLQDQESVVMHRLIYEWSQARGSPRRVAKIRLVDTSDGGKSPSGFSLEPPHSAARHLTSQHDLNNLNPVSGISSS